MLIFAFSAFALAGCGKKAPPAPVVTITDVDDLTKVQGKWGIADALAAGDEPKPPPELLSSVTFMIEGDRLRVEPGRGRTVYAQLKIDPSKSPKEVDFITTDEKGKPETMPPTTFMKNMPPPPVRDPVKAIYKFEGDQLIVAFPTDPRLPRPTEFQPKAWPKEIPGQGGPGTIVFTLKKLPTDAKPAAPEVVDKLVSSNNLKQVGLAIMNFDSANGALPARVLYDKADKPGLSWRVSILPYLEEDALYNQFKLDEPWDSPNNKPLIAKIPKVYSKPGGDASKGETFIKVFHGPTGIFSNNQISGMIKTNRTTWSVASLTSSPRGTSNIIFCAEAGDPVIWTKPDDFEYDPKKPLPNLKGIYDGGFHALMGDGRVVFIPIDFKQSALRASIDPNSISAELLAP
jgi:uncharacterized protein (TIGR03067 family)